MIWALLGRIAGPRVLLGVLLAAGLAIGFLWWQMSSAREAAGEAQQQAADLRDSLKASNGEVERLIAERKRLSQAIAVRDTRHRADRLKIQEAEDDLAKIEEQDKTVRTWVSSPVPAAVRSWLCHPASGADQNCARKPPAEPDPNVPDATLQHGDKR